VLMLYNPAVYDVADIIDTYMYRMTFARQEFSLSIAAGFFRGLIGCILIFLANKFTKRVGKLSLY